MTTDPGDALLADVPDGWRAAIASAVPEATRRALAEFVAAERAAGDVYPPASEVFAALGRTPLVDVKAVILGQDPYHGPGQAHGLAFSVPAGRKPPPSLANILRELADDQGVPTPVHGDLSAWAERGVLLLNTVLTVRAHEAGSHARRGWERVTDAIVDAVAARERGAVFVLWGGPAQKKASRIDAGRHRVILGVHPSPLSAYRGFAGSKPFSRVNEALIDLGHTPIDWSL